MYEFRGAAASGGDPSVGRVAVRTSHRDHRFTRDAYTAIGVAALALLFLTGCPGYLPPDPVDTLECRAKPTKVDLTWTPVPEALRYAVYRSVDDGPLRPISLQSELVYADLGLENGHVYRYEIRSVNLGGQSKRASNRCAAVPCPRGERCDVPENAPPEIISTPSTMAVVGMPYVYPVEAIDPDGDAPFIELAIAPEGMQLDPRSGVVMWTPASSQIGDFDVSIIATDPEGDSDSQSFVVTVAEPGPGNLPPMFTSTPPTMAMQEMLFSYDADAEDPEGAALLFTLEMAPSGMTIDPSTGLIEWTPAANQVGPQSVVVRSADPPGLFATQQFDLEVAPIATQNMPPQITSTPVTQAPVAAPYRYDVDATDPEGLVITYSLMTAPAGMSIDAGSGLIRWTPTPAQVGAQSVTVRARDPGGLTDLQEFTINVFVETFPPIFTSVPLTTAVESSLYYYDPTAEDPDGGDVSIAVERVPAGMVMHPAGLLRWAPTASQIGPQTVHLLATDDEGETVPQVFEIQVAALPQAPLITSLPITAGEVGVAYGYDVEAYDPEGEALTYSFVDAPPAGMTIDPVTGRIDWTPPAGAPDAVALGVRAADPGGLFDEQSFTLKIVEDDVLLVSPSGDYGISVGETLSLPVSSNYSTAVLSASPAIPNADLGDDGDWVFEPRAGQEGVYVVAFQARIGTRKATSLVRVTVGVNNAPPSIDPIPPQTVAEGQSLTFAVSGSDPDGDVLRFAATDVVDNAVFNEFGRLYEFQPSYDQAGTYEVGFSVDDGAASAETIVTITVTESAPPPERLELVVDPPASPTLSRTVTITGNVVGAPGIPATATLPPFLTSLAPASARQGRTAEVTLGVRGIALVPGATTASFGAGIEVTALVVEDASTARASIAIDENADIGTRRVSITSEGERADSVVAFFVEPGAAQLSGVVRDPLSGQPLAGARVVVRGSATEVVTDQNGAFTLDGLPPGDVSLLIAQPNYELGYLDVIVSNNQVVDLDSPVEMRALARPAAPGGTLPRAASLISVIDRGMNAKGGGLDVEQAKLVIQDTILAVGGADLGVLDEAGNQLNPRIGGDGFMSLTPLAVEAQALALVDGEVQSLGVVLNDLVTAFSWAGPIFDPRNIVDDFNRIAEEAWANPESPDSALAIMLFNEGNRISSAPPIITMDSRLNRFQAFLLVTSFLTTYSTQIELLANQQLIHMGLDPEVIGAQAALARPGESFAAPLLATVMGRVNRFADWLVPAASAQPIPPNQPAQGRDDRLERSVRAVWKKATSAQFAAELIVEAIINQGVQFAAQKIMVNIAGRTAGLPGAVGAIAVTQALTKGAIATLGEKLLELWRIERAVLNYEPDATRDIRSAQFETINGARRFVITFRKSDTEIAGGPQAGLDPIIQPSTVLNQVDGIQPENFRYTYQLLKYPNCQVRDYADNGVRLVLDASLQPVFRKDAEGNATDRVEENLLQFVLPPDVVKPGLNFFRIVTFQIYSKDDIALNAARIEHKFTDVGIKVEPLRQTIYKEVVTGVKGIPGDLTEELAKIVLEQQAIQEALDAGTLSEADLEFRVRAQDKRINQKLQAIKDGLADELVSEGWDRASNALTPPDRRNVAMNLMEEARQGSSNPDDWLDPSSPIRQRAVAELGEGAIDDQTAQALRDMHFDLNDADNARVDMDLSATAVERIKESRRSGADLTFQQIEIDGTVRQRRYTVALTGDFLDLDVPSSQRVPISVADLVSDQELRVQQAAQRHSLATSGARLRTGTINERMLDTAGSLTRLKTRWNESRLGSSLAKLQSYKARFNKWKSRLRLGLDTLDVIGEAAGSADARSRPKNALDVPEFDGNGAKVDRNLRIYRNLGNAISIGGKLYSLYDFQKSVAERARLLISPPSKCFQVEGDSPGGGGFNIETHPNSFVDGVIAPIPDPDNARGGFLAINYPGTDWAPTLARAGFPSQMIATDSRGNIYANNAPSNFSYGGRMFRYDQVIPGGDFQLSRQLIGAVNYYSLQLQYGRPSEPLSMEIADYTDEASITWEDLFVAEFDIASRPGFRIPRIRRIPIHLIERFPGGYDGPQRNRVASVAYAEHPDFQFTGVIDMEVGPPGFFAPNNPPRPLYVSDNQRVFRLFQTVPGLGPTVETFIDLPGRQFTGMAFDGRGNFFLIDAAVGTLYVMAWDDLVDPVTSEEEFSARAYPIKIGLQNAYDVEISGDENRYYVSTANGISAFFMPVVGREGPDIRTIRIKNGAREYDVTRRGLGANNTFVAQVTHDDLINSELRILVERRDPGTGRYAWDEVTAELAAFGITIIEEAL